MEVWTRECQECGRVQIAKQPIYGAVTDAYLNRECRYCKSTALEYGRFRDMEQELRQSRAALFNRLL